MLIQAMPAAVSQGAASTTQASQSALANKVNTAQLAEDTVQFSRAALANANAEDWVNIELGNISLPPP